MTIVATNVEARPFGEIQHMLQKGASFQDIRDVMRCSYELKFGSESNACAVRNYLLSNPCEKKVLVLTDIVFKSYVLKMLALQGWQIDFKRLEDYDKLDISNYDYIVANNLYQDSDYFNYFESRKNYYKIQNGFPSFSKVDKSPCIYFAKGAVPVAGDNEKSLKPVYVVCYTPKKDFAQHNFKKVFVAQNPNDDLSNNKILIYKNMSKQNR